MVKLVNVQSSFPEKSEWYRQKLNYKNRWTNRSETQLKMQTFILTQKCKEKIFGEYE